MTDEGKTVIGLEGLKLKFGNLEQIFAENEALNEIGEYLVTKIKWRTEKGVDVKGMYFQPYTPRYRLFRQKLGLPTARVDLTLSGAMLNSLTYSASSARSEVRIFFMPGTGRRVGKGSSVQPRNKTQNPAKAYYLQQKRNFFGLADVDKSKVLSIYNQKIREALKSGR